MTNLYKVKLIPKVKPVIKLNYNNTISNVRKVYSKDNKIVSIKKVKFR